MAVNYCKVTPVITIMEDYYLKPSGEICPHYAPTMPPPDNINKHDL